jgi:hypothetical protein
MANNAFKDEAYQGKVNEDYLRVFIEDKSGWSIDGKNRNTDVGIKYSANYSDLNDMLLSNLDKSVHWDFVFETLDDEKVIPVFLDSKSTGCAPKDFVDIAIKAQCFKNKFPNCEIHLIYHGLKSKYESVLDKLVDSGLINSYSTDGLKDNGFEHIFKDTVIIEPNINKFF